MNFFATPTHRKILFASLYLSEGAPIGFIWLALPTRLRAHDVPVEQITGLAALLVLPWTFKFTWAPLVDLLRGRSWTLRHWIVAAQSVMGLTLLPLIWIEPARSFSTLTLLLLAHAIAAATQDVAIDALCISTTQPGERGQYNGWMQAGMLIGRAMMGGGALVLAQYIGDAAVIVLLVFLTTFSMSLVIMSPPPTATRTPTSSVNQWAQLRRILGQAAMDRNTWLGLLFAATGGAAFKSLEVIYGPFLVDRGLSSAAIGWFSLGPMIGLMVAGALLGGWLTDRFGPRQVVMLALISIAVSVASLGLTDWILADRSRWPLLAWLAVTAFGIGVFTAASYALFMDIARPALAATQFSAFMGATNGCESWSSLVAGRLIGHFDYPTAMLTMSVVSLIALPLIAGLEFGRRQTAYSGHEPNCT